MLEKSWYLSLLRSQVCMSYALFSLHRRLAAAHRVCFCSRVPRAHLHITSQRLVMARPAKQTLRIGLCTNVSGLGDAVRDVFAASPLAAEYNFTIEEATDAMSDVEIVLADPGKLAPLLDREGSLGALRWLQSTWAGVNPLAGAKRRGYTCTRLAGCFGPQMAEYVFGAILSEDWRKLGALQAKGHWEPDSFKKRRRLEKMTLGCLGIGDIASVIGQRAQAFGMRTVGFASRARPADGFHEVSTDLAQVLCAADIIVSVLPSTPQTRGLLDGNVLRSCGKDKLFINVGRGDVISEESLLAAFEEGWLSLAALDVFAIEPLPPTSALWKHPAVRISPHIAAVTYPEDTARLFVENLGLWLKGRPLQFVVDLDKGY